MIPNQPQSIDDIIVQDLIGKRAAVFGGMWEERLKRLQIGEAPTHLSLEQALGFVALELAIANELKEIEILQRATQHGGGLEENAARAMIDGRLGELLKSYGRTPPAAESS